MDPNELKYWIAFNRVSRVGRARILQLEERFGVLSDAWRANSGDLSSAGIDPSVVKSIVSSRSKIDPDSEIDLLDVHGVRALTWHDNGYPDRLKEIYDRPPVLYIKGDLMPEDERSVAIVGTRGPTAYGREVAHRLTFDLAKAGVVIVSGLARGVDGIAHRAAIEAGQRTIAVMGSGLDVMYPREHGTLASAIMENGGLVSEHPLGTRPSASNFPRRNRIMAGMTLGTLVVEAPESSGALSTASHALNENREVFAVPGNVFSPKSVGTNNLIKKSGAKLVTNYNDILEELNLSSIGQQIELKALIPEDENESGILRYVTYDPVHIDEVIRNSGIDIASVSSTLAMMELKGLIKQVGGMNYIRLRETPTEYQATA